MRSPAFRALLIGLAAPAGAQSQDVFPGNPQTGQAFARDVCAPCHLVSPWQFGGEFAFAPSFRDIANMPGMTATALSAWLIQTPHPTTPNLILSPEEAQDVVAYILSLRERR